MSGLELFGHVGNVLFFSRWIVQWVASEKAGESRAPAAFFWLSLGGTVVLFTYTLLRDERVLLGGYAANLVFYSRSLVLAHRPRTARRPSGGLVALAGLLLAGSLVSAVLTERHEAESTAWLACGILGQSVFGARFAVQWWFSELKGHSHFPRVFWWISLTGSLLLLAYAIHTGQSVWIVGQATAWLIPIRNLILDARVARTTPGEARAA